VQVAAQTMAQGENSSSSSNGGVPKVGAINQWLHYQAKEHMVVDEKAKLLKLAILRKAIDYIRHLREKNRWPKS
jgi:Helix-loop-helix DNA-binding domain